MSIPRKKSRKLVVDGKPFLWLLKPSNGCGWYMRPDPCDQLRFVAQEDADKPGRPVLVDLGKWGSRSAFTPKDAEAVIRLGLEEGWDPSSKSGAGYWLKGNPRLDGFDKLSS